MNNFLNLSLMWFSQNSSLIAKLCENSTATYQIINRQKILNRRKIKRRRNKIYLLLMLSKIIDSRSSPRCWQLVSTLI